MQEIFDVTPNTDVKGYLKTPDGLVVLRASIPETFEIARKMLDLMEKRIKEGDKKDE